MHMKYPNFNEEKKLWRNGYNVVAGLDEAGRGPLAGPVVAAAVLINKNDKVFKNIKINDSKKISAKNRELFYNILTNHKDIEWGIGIVSEKVIDKINILQASKLAMVKAIEDLGVKADFLLIDGNFGINVNIPQKGIIKGDQKVFSISAASILAKVTRDNIMQNMHEKYPEYRFDLHKGYGTALHINNLKSFGPCKIHRKTFYPVNSIANSVSSIAKNELI